MAGASRFVDAKIRNRKVVLFTKKSDPACRIVKEVLDLYNMKSQDYEVCEIDNRQDCAQIENYFLVICLTSNRCVPRLFVNGRYIGGDPIDIQRFHHEGTLRQVLSSAGVDTKLAEAILTGSDNSDGLRHS